MFDKSSFPTTSTTSLVRFVIGAGVLLTKPTKRQTLEAWRYRYRWLFRRRSTSTNIRTLKSGPEFREQVNFLGSPSQNTKNKEIEIEIVTFVVASCT